MIYPPKNLQIETILETEDFLVLNKLPDIIVQQAKDNPNSLSRHLSYLKEEKKEKNKFNYMHVHRLDKDSSGTLLIAKNQETLSELNKIFRERKIKKNYLALCLGIFKEKEGEIKIKLERAEQSAKEKVKVSQSKEGKETHSKFKVLEEYYLEDCELSLVKVELLTGFMHQIRVHMKYLGHPLLGDEMYGNSYLNKKFSEKLNRQFLHASSLQFEYKEKNYVIEAKLTQDLDSFLKQLIKNPSCMKKSFIMS